MHKKELLLTHYFEWVYFIDSGISIIPSLYAWRNVAIE